MTAQPGYFDTSYPPSLWDGSGGPGARVTLSIADASVAAGASADANTTLTNEGPKLTELNGYITVDNTLGAATGDISLVMKDFDGPGKDRTVALTAQGGKLTGTYGPFPLYDHQHGATVDEWSAKANTPKGAYAGTTEIRRGTTVLGSDTWTLTVT